MANNFQFDVFLSYSSGDALVVRDAAQKLRSAGIKVWFDEWELEPGDSVMSKIEHALEHSRVLALFMSANSFGSDWTNLESGTFRFRDPVNSERRFLPIRLDDSPLKGSLGQFLFLDWRDSGRREKSFHKLLEACRHGRFAGAPSEDALNRKLQISALSLGHSEAILTVAWGPDEQTLLCGCADKTVRLWNGIEGRSTRVLEGHLDRISTVAWSPDGQQIVSGSDDGTVRLWDAREGGLLKVLEPRAGAIKCTAWSPDGARALICAGSTIQIWDMKEYLMSVCFEGHEDRVRSGAWSPNGRLIISGSEDRTLRLWDVEGVRLLKTLRGHTDIVTSVAWNPEGLNVVSGSQDGSVRIWNAEKGLQRNCLMGHNRPITSVSWSPREGNLVVSASYDKTAKVWDIMAQKEKYTLTGHADQVLSVSWSPDGLRLATGSQDKTVRLWRLRAEIEDLSEILPAHAGRVECVAWSTDGLRALSGSSDNSICLWKLVDRQLSRVFEGHTKAVSSVAWSPDHKSALSGSYDGGIRTWDIETGSSIRIFDGHEGAVLCVLWSPDGRRALSSSDDGTLKLWDVERGSLLHSFEGHTGAVLCAGWISGGQSALSGSDDSTLRVWDVRTARAVGELRGHTASVRCVACSPDGRYALSGSSDTTVRVWDLKTSSSIGVLEGHAGPVYSVLWSADGRTALSSSADGTVRVWEVDTGRSLGVLTAHSDVVNSIALSPDGRRAYSSSINGVMRAWNLPALVENGAESEILFHDQVLYTNAKVLLVGESGAGKTGLAKRLALNEWCPTDSTVGAWATQWKIPVGHKGSLEREIWLWDFGGQADQRLIHQLYMDDTALAVVVFDGQKEQLFEALGHWDRDLNRSTEQRLVKLLAAGRIDSGGLRVSRAEVEDFARERGFKGRLFETSAKTGADCDELRDAIVSQIPWDDLAWRASPLVFKLLKEEIVKLKDEGCVILRFNELRDALKLRLSGTRAYFEDAQLKAVLGLLSGPGVVWELKFGNLILLQPERINAYAQAVIQTLRQDPSESGSIPEELVLSGNMLYHSTLPRLDKENERFVLLAMHQALVERGLCLREDTEHGPLLIFPSYYKRERPELVGHPAVLVSYTFSGFLDEIYATLVVRLHHTKAFHRNKLWRYAADFNTLTGKKLGIKLNRRAEGAGELQVYFDPAISIEEKIIFIRYVHEHLAKTRDVERLRHYVCPHCGTPVENRDVAMRRLRNWLAENSERSAGGLLAQRIAVGKAKRPTIICANCEKRVQLWDELEELFASNVMHEHVQVLRQQSATVLDSTSRERALVGDIISTVSLAGQISREFPVVDHGINMEIDFDESGSQDGKLKLYLLLRFSDAFLRDRPRDGAQVFEVDDEDSIYWSSKGSRVMLTIRESGGLIKWMEITDIHRREAKIGPHPRRQAAFVGELFNVVSVREWRNKLIEAKPKLQAREKHQTSGGF